MASVPEPVGASHSSHARPRTISASVLPSTQARVSRAGASGARGWAKGSVSPTGRFDRGDAGEAGTGMLAS
jgi:hypothetical protein